MKWTGLADMDPYHTIMRLITNDAFNIELFVLANAVFAMAEIGAISRWKAKLRTLTDPRSPGAGGFPRWFFPPFRRASNPLNFCQGDDGVSTKQCDARRFVKSYGTIRNCMLVAPPQRVHDRKVQVVDPVGQSQPSANPIWHLERTSS